MEDEVKDIKNAKYSHKNITGVWRTSTGNTMYIQDGMPIIIYIPGDARRYFGIPEYDSNNRILTVSFGVKKLVLSKNYKSLSIFGENVEWLRELN